jgi:inosine-uridine nucleoside N-ribohydrolase
MKTWHRDKYEVWSMDETGSNEQRFQRGYRFVFNMKQKRYLSSGPAKTDPTAIVNLHSTGEFYDTVELAVG